jgi:hypothetical protein
LFQEKAEDDEGYIVDLPDLNACSAFEKTPDETLQEVQKPKSCGCRLPRLRKKPIPPPRYWPVIYQAA